MSKLAVILCALMLTGAIAFAAYGATTSSTSSKANIVPEATERWVPACVNRHTGNVSIRFPTENSHGSKTFKCTTSERVVRIVISPVKHRASKH